MNKMLKSTLGVAAAVALTGVTVAPAVLAWGDNTGGRATYSISQINAGEIDDKIVFNSIVASDADLTDANREAGDIIPLSDERNFVGARIDDGNHGKNNVWNGNEITVEEGKTYIVRMYIHNNNRLGEQMVAKDVTASFLMQDFADTTFKVDGIFTSSNATPNRYWDSVVFKSNTGSRFYLDYIEGSALLENNSYAANGGKTLSDELIGNGVKIGYDALDGNVPGCYKYAEYVSFKVKPVFEDSSIEKKVRLDGTNDWTEDLHANIGDTVEYQIKYQNLNDSQVNDVVLIDSLPDNVEYIKGTTVLYNGLYPNGITNTNDTITTTGINIGYYPVNAQAVVRFKAKVVDNSLVCGNNQLINWAKIGSTTVGYAVQDSTNVFVEKTCTPDDPKPPVNPDDKEETVVVKKTTTTTVNELPSTGPAAVAGTALGAGTIVTAAGYLISSRKQLR